MFATVLITDDIEAGRRALAGYAEATYRMPLEVVESVQVLIAGPVDAVAARLGRYIEAGARHIVCRIGATDLAAQSDQLEPLSALHRALDVRSGTGQPAAPPAASRDRTWSASAAPASVNRSSAAIQ